MKAYVLGIWYRDSGHEGDEVKQDDTQQDKPKMKFTIQEMK